MGFLGKVSKNVVTLSNNVVFGVEIVELSTRWHCLMEKYMANKRSATHVFSLLSVN